MDHLLSWTIEGYLNLVYYYAKKESVTELSIVIFYLFNLSQFSMHIFVFADCQLVSEIIF